MLKPLPSDRWNFTTAAHLLNRAGFGGPPAEVDWLASLTPAQAVSHFVDYEEVTVSLAGPDWAKPDPERAERYRAAQQASPEERQKILREAQRTVRGQMMELRNWWLQRMVSGPRPLQERLTLFWHGHFATSIEKVRDPYLMWRQNDLFRRHAMGNWLELLVEVARDPAMLVWLDQAQSRKEHPNENFAREVMELFALGEGHYTEKDVTEAARALTGWSYDRRDQEFIERPFAHDRGVKTIFGRSGNFNGEDFLEMVVAQPQAARFITARIWDFFAGKPPSEQVTAALAEVFRGAGNTFKPMLQTMFLSEEFYSASIIRNQVKSPVQWLVGSVRVLERPLPGPLICFGLMRNLGQELFAPPNVKGWDGGLSWITTNTLLARYNEAATLVQGDPTPAAAGMFPRNPNAGQQMARRLSNLRIGGADVEKLFSEHERTDKDALVPALEKRLLQGKLRPDQERVLRDYLAGKVPLDNEAVRGAIRLVMSTPEYQLT
jgi:uncharacterized protein (DUF1800 family)